MPEKRPFWIFGQILSIPLIMLVVLALVLAGAWVAGGANGWPGGDADPGAAIYGFSAVCTFLSMWLVLGGVFAYINIGQAKKIEIITGFYSPDTIAKYFFQFRSGSDGILALVSDFQNATVPAAQETAANALTKKFQAMFAEDFGARVFVIPAIMATAAGSIVLFLGYAGAIGLAVALGNASQSPVHPLGLSFDLVSVAAIFGAYTWVTSDVIVRNHLWTLHPSDLVWYALRFIIAIPLGQALALLVSPHDVNTSGTALATSGPFVAFVVSMFSLDAITKALGTAATRFGVQLKASNEERDDLIVRLAGVDDDTARALNVEGVSTIAQLVTVDPIRTSISSGLSFEYILNLVDAALLWVFVGDALKPLHKLGLRGASDVLSLDDDWYKPSIVALTALRHADADLATAHTAEATAQAALTAAQAQAGVEQAALAPLQANLATATAALNAAAQARTDALTAFLSAPGLPPGPAQDRTSMLTAVEVAVKDGGPGLTQIGFTTMAARLQESSYAKFIRQLLSS